MKVRRAVFPVAGRGTPRLPGLGMAGMDRQPGSAISPCVSGRFRPLERIGGERFIDSPFRAEVALEESELLRGEEG